MCFTNNTELPSLRVTGNWKPVQWQEALWAKCLINCHKQRWDLSSSSQPHGNHCLLNWLWKCPRPISMVTPRWHVPSSPLPSRMYRSFPGATSHEKWQQMRCRGSYEKPHPPISRHCKDQHKCIRVPLLLTTYSVLQNKSFLWKSM